MVWSDAHEDRDVVGIELRAQLTERTVSDGLEHLTRFLKERTLVFLPKPLDLIFQKMGGQAKAEKTRCILSQRGRARLGLLAKIGSGIADPFEFLFLGSELEQSFADRWQD